MGGSPSMYPGSFPITNGPRPKPKGAAQEPRPQNMYHQTHVPQPMPQPRVHVDVKQILERIEKTIVHWSPIIKNSKEDFKSKKGFSLSFLQYLSFELHQTETEWHDIIKLLPKQIERSEDHGSREAIPKKNRRPVPKSQNNAEYERSIESHQDVIKNLSEMLTKEKERIAIHLEENDRLREQLRHMKEENENLLLRLSKVASDRLLKSNPNIADLSDPNRPTKIGEAYSEAYDNEYTDAFTELNEAGYTEIEAVNILRETLLNTFEFCSKKSTEFLTKTEDALKVLFLDESEPMGMGDNPHRGKTPATLTPGQGKYLARELTNIGDLQFALKWKPKDREAKSEMGQSELIEKRTSMREKGMKAFEDQMKKLRKEIAVHMVPYIQKAYLKTRWDADCIKGMKPFIKKCVFLTWLMTVQSPPMAFLQPPKAEERFDGGRYRSYTKSGETIDYVVWPTLMLTKDGPIIIKGIAQGK